MDIDMKMKQIIGLLLFLQALACIHGYEYNYIGCFGDRKSPNRALPVKHKGYLANSVDYCVKKCGDGGYRYLGLAEGIQCWCGNSGYDRYGESHSCFYPCTGNFSQICGGRHRNSVYEIVGSSIPAGSTTWSVTSANMTSTTTDSTTRKPTATASITAIRPTANPSPFQNGVTAPAHGIQTIISVSIGIAVGAVVGCAIIVLAAVLTRCSCLREVPRRDFAMDEEMMREFSGSSKGSADSVGPAPARADAVRHENGVYDACRYTVLPERPKHVTDIKDECTVLATSTEL